VTKIAVCSVRLVNKCRVNSVARAMTMNVSIETSLAQRWQYQHITIDFAGGDQGHFGASPSDYEDNVDNADRVRNSDVAWPCRKRYGGRARRSQSVTICATKSKWTRRRSRDRVAECPLNVGARIDGVVEIIDDYRACESSKRIPDFIRDCGGGTFGCEQIEETIQVLQLCNTDTLQRCVVDRPPYETLLVDEEITPLLFNDVNGLRSTLRYGCVGNGTPEVVDCLPCEIVDCPPCEVVECPPCEDENDRVIIECCCRNNSRLGRPSRYSQGCRVARLTIDDDLRTLDGLHKALEIVKRCPPNRTSLWNAMPCVGRSPLQRINSALGIGIEKLDTHWRDFCTL
jgi:hypothetical protein